jgi:hypothetical protein
MKKTKTIVARVSLVVAVQQEFIRRWPLGKLNGSKGPKKFDPSCLDGLMVTSGA